MRLVISDTGPVNYLILIGHIDVLPELFPKIIMPAAVMRELTSASAPKLVRQWMDSTPAWIEIHPYEEPVENDMALDALDNGERAAIAMALALPTDALLLMDDRDGVAAARRRGLAVTGTIGILNQAARRGLLNLAEAFGRLRKTNFHCPEALMESLLADHEKK